MTTNLDTTPVPSNSQENSTNWRDLDLSTPEGRNLLNREIARRRNQDPAETYDWAYNYANSVDAALVLIGTAAAFHLIKYDNMQKWYVSIDPDNASYYDALSDTPALAICCAWLAMMDAKGGVK